MVWYRKTVGVTLQVAAEEPTRPHSPESRYWIWYYGIEYDIMVLNDILWYIEWYIMIWNEILWYIEWDIMILNKINKILNKILNMILNTIYIE